MSLRRSSVLPTSLVLLLPALVQLGCGSGGGGPTDPLPPATEWPADALRLPEADAAAATASRVRYLELRGTLDADAARAALLAELNDGWPDLDEALLGADGQSFTLRFRDGATAILSTDEEFRSPPPDDGKRADRHGKPGSPAAGAGAKPAGAAKDWDCDTITVPPNHKVKIVSLVTSADPGQFWQAEFLRDDLMERGWDEQDIEIVQDTYAEPYRLTPDELFELEGFGLVVILGETATVVDAEGNEHLALQCCAGGDYQDGWDEVVGESRWEDYEQWQREGRLVTCYTTNSYSDTVPQIYVRDDLLYEETYLSYGAVVTLIGNDTDQLFDEYSHAMAGGVTGWHDQTDGVDGAQAFLALIDAMAESDDLTVAQGVAGVHASGGGMHHSYFSDDSGYLVASPSAAEATLPAWGDARFWDFDDELPEGSARVQVTLTSDECPEESYTYQMHPDSVVSYDGLLPGSYSERVLVFDDSGAIVAGGYTCDLLFPGHNYPNYSGICWSEATLLPSDLPSGDGIAVTNLHVDLSAEDGQIACSFDLPPGSPPPMTHLIPADYEIAVTAEGEGGVPLGRHAFLKHIQCDDNDVPACFGWLVLETGTLAPEVASLDVTVDSAFSSERTVTLAPGQTLPVCGFATGEAVAIGVTARDVHGEPVATFSHPVDVLSCGANTVVLEVLGYGILLEATPHKLPPDGSSAATVVATARLRRAGDVLEPTGDPVVGLRIDFDTSCGTFLGADGGITDADGEVTVRLASGDPCLAVVHAFNETDAVQSRPTYVNFNARLSFWINGSSAPVQAPSLQGVLDVSCAQIRFTLRDYLMSEPICAVEDGFWGVYVPNNAWVGDEVGLSFTRWAENTLCDEDASHSVGAVWVHTAYLPDFSHQRAYQLTAGASLQPSVAYSVTFEEIAYYADGPAIRAAATGDGEQPFYEQRDARGPVPVWRPLTAR